MRGDWWSGEGRSLVGGVLRAIAVVELWRAIAVVELWRAIAGCGVVVAISRGEGFEGDRCCGEVEGDRWWVEWCEAIAVWWRGGGRSLFGGVVGGEVRGDLWW